MNYNLNKVKILSENGKCVEFQFGYFVNEKIDALISFGEIKNTDVNIPFVEITDKTYDIYQIGNQIKEIIKKIGIFPKE